MHKTAADMRDKRKKDQVEEQKRVDGLKEKDSEAYLANLYERRRRVMEKMQLRTRQKEDLQKRGSKTAQKRMRMLVELGTSEKG